jgi:hypothetical protein
VEFLDSVLEASRSKEAEVKKETKEQLDAFRKRQEDAEKAARQDEAAGSPEPASTWSVAPRKRKTGREKEGLGGLKLRKTSMGEEQTPLSAQGAKHAEQDEAKGDAAKVSATHAGDIAPPLAASHVDSRDVKASSKGTPQLPPALGLAGYSSDED